jgi:hypothetical protein
MIIISQMRAEYSRGWISASRPFGGRSAWLSMVVTCALLVALLWAPGVDATTGPTPLTKPPLWTLSKRQARPFIGRFKLAAPRGKQLINAAYAAEINEYGYLEGTLVVYTYDEAGRETSWVARTYEYHPKGPGKMAIDVISPANENIFARLHLRVIAGGKLTGTLEPIRPPLAPVRTQRISLRRVR